MSTAITTPPVPSPESLWAVALTLQCDLQIDLKVVGFTVRDLLRLEPNSLVVSTGKLGSNVPLYVNDVVLAWSEFEVLGDTLAVRLMEFA